jgi:hypothetical protein
MKKAKLIICVVSATLAAISPARAQAHRAGDAVPVGAENFIHAKGDSCFSAVGLGRDTAPAEDARA